MPKTKNKQPLTRKGLWTSVIILLIGLTVGFLLLATVYTGPTIWKVLVTILYFIVVILMIKNVKKLDAYLKEQNKKDSQQN